MRSVMSNLVIASVTFLDSSWSVLESSVITDIIYACIIVILVATTADVVWYESL